MKRILILIFALMLFLVSSGCNRNSSSDNKEEDTAKIDLVVYLPDVSAGVINAHKLSVNVLDTSIELSQDVLFKVSDDIGWQDRIYPSHLSSESLVLPYEPTEQPLMEYTLATEGKLYNADYVLSYNKDQSVATIHEGDMEIASIDMTLDGNQLIPQAFFVDDEGSIAVLCNTKGETFDKVNPVSLLYTKKGDNFQLEKTSDFSTIFDEFDLSKINMPNYTNISTNIYGNPQSKTFLWNEGANIVELNPYNGTTRVILTVSDIEKDLPHLDTHRDFYEFFTGLGYQNDVYIASFPNYNDISGTISVFYSETGEFLGSVLCTENNISIFDNKNTEKDRIDNIKTISRIFIPQSTLD